MSLICGVAGFALNVRTDLYCAFFVAFGQLYCVFPANKEADEEVICHLLTAGVAGADMVERRPRPVYIFAPAQTGTIPHPSCYALIQVLTSLLYFTRRSSRRSRCVTLLHYKQFNNQTNVNCSISDSHTFDATLPPAGHSQTSAFIFFLHPSSTRIFQINSCAISCTRFKCNKVDKDCGGQR